MIRIFHLFCVFTFHEWGFSVFLIVFSWKNLLNEYQMKQQDKKKIKLLNCRNVEMHWR